MAGGEEPGDGATPGSGNCVGSLLLGWHSVKEWTLIVVFSQEVVVELHHASHVVQEDDGDGVQEALEDPLAHF